ncbi:uncharacterized protein METZ01_LOCUS25408 [marine metagenome]|uniref:Uncharacterized protein n=1 Tax=marine metagenome TaxID=408172 RepID=A0A381Q111_9ZZZZ
MPATKNARAASATATSAVFLPINWSRTLLSEI